MSELPTCDVYGCEKPAPLQYTDNGMNRCWDCAMMDRDMEEMPDQ